MKQIILLLSISCFFFHTNCNTITNISDSVEDNSNIHRYEDWMKWEGIHPYLSIYNDSLYNDDRGNQTLYLEFSTNNVDSIVGIWNSMKSVDHQIPQKGSLEERLFFAMINVFRIEPNKARIELYDTYDSSKDYKFEILIFYENGRVVMQENLPKLIVDNFSVKRSDVRSVKFDKSGVIDFSELYKGLFEWSENYFKKSNDIKIAKDSPSFNEPILSFYISGLRNEILPDDVFCYVFKLLSDNDCPIQRTEMLKVTIEIEEKDDLILVEYQLDGRYGSGFTGERDWEKGNPMEPEFTFYFQEFVQQYEQEMYDYLIQ